MKTKQAKCDFLFDSGDIDNDMSVVLVDGILVIRTRLGSGSFEVEMKPPNSNVRYDDSQWHRVTVTREAREVRINTPSFARGH